MLNDNLPLQFQLSTYDFEIPQEKIAQFPAQKRTDSRLLDFSGSKIRDIFFRDLRKVFPTPVLFVRNNTKVFKARIFGHKKTGARIEALLYEKEENGLWKGYFRPSKKIHPGDFLYYPENLVAKVEKKLGGGVHLVSFLGCENLYSYLDRFGETPLPPYITEFTGNEERYQTVYAKKTGAAAAPTAGLHFDDTMILELEKNGYLFCDVTLHVGPGTFKPIETEDIRNFEIHREWVEVDENAAAMLLLAKQRSLPVVAVGTTSLRCLESAFLAVGAASAYHGFTQLYLYPGKKIQSIDYLLTNFHLPKSSLLVLVSSLIGIKEMKKIYSHALRSDYRFFSFGDCMVLPNLS